MGINFYKAPVIGKLWTSSKGFISGYIYTLDQIKDELYKCDLDPYNKPIKIFLFKNEKKVCSTDSDYLVKLINELPIKKRNKSLEEMREEDLLKHEMEEARNLEIKF
jgi:hypothetical protein